VQTLHNERPVCGGGIADATRPGLPSVRRRFAALVCPASVLPGSIPRTIQLPLATSPSDRLARPRSAVGRSEFRHVVGRFIPCSSSALQACPEPDGPFGFVWNPLVACRPQETALGMLAQILGVFGSRLLPLEIHAKEKYELVVCLAGLQSYSRADINMFQFRTKHP
jgi:hypothetical protein